MYKRLLLKRSFLPWLIFIFSFFACWFYLVITGNNLTDVLNRWPISIAMLMGSYAAGSTPMGGGTVGFPVLVYIFDYPPHLGRDFSFVIQSIGMVSASIFIICSKQKINWVILKGAMVGAVIGLPLGLFLISPFIDADIAKYIFTVIWAAFGLYHLFNVQKLCAQSIPNTIQYSEKKIFLLGGLLGILSSAFVVSLTGVGIDMFIYMAMVLILKQDLKHAIVTSVLIMAFCSVLGVLCLYLSSFGHAIVSQDVYLSWLAAAPIVIFGAPLGVIAVNILGRQFTLTTVAILCILQYFYVALNDILVLNFNALSISAFCIVGLNFVFHVLGKTSFAKNDI